METSLGENISEKIKSGVQKAVTELEELRVQLALGKLEAKDLFEENKKEFQTSLSEIKIQMENLKKEPLILDLINKMEHLRVQLELGKIESKLIFEEQYTKISKALHDFESELKNNKTINEYYAKAQLEVAKFKIKLELFALHYKLKKINLAYDFKIIKSQIESKLNDFKTQVNKKSSEGKAKWDEFNEEITDVYEHLKNIFKN